MVTLELPSEVLTYLHIFKDRPYIQKFTDICKTKQLEIVSNSINDICNLFNDICKSDNCRYH